MSCFPESMTLDAENVVLSACVRNNNVTNFRDAFADHDSIPFFRSFLF